MKKIFCTVLLIAVLVVSAFSFAGCKDKEEVIIIGYDNGFPPMGFTDATGKDVGFDLDLATEVFAVMGKKIEFKPIEWKLKETLLNSQEIDVIWNGYTITDGRRELVAFSTPYMKNSQCVVVRIDSTIATVADIGTSQIAVQESSSAVEAMYENDLLKTRITATENGFISDASITSCPNNVIALWELESRGAEAFVTDYVLANYLINTAENTGKFKILQVNLWDEEYGIGVRKADTELLSGINNALVTLKGNGKLAEIAAKWGLTDALLI